MIKTVTFTGISNYSRLTAPTGVRSNFPDITSKFRVAATAAVHDSRSIFHSAIWRRSLAFRRKRDGIDVSGRLCV